MGLDRFDFEEVAFIACARLLAVSKFMEDVGEIIVTDADGEFFWTLPAIFLESSQLYCITSPCFTFNEDKWNLAFAPETDYDLQTGCHERIKLFLWMKNFSSKKQNYGVHLGCQSYSCDGETKEGAFEFSQASYCWGENYGRIKVKCILQVLEHEPSVIKTSSDCEDHENENKDNGDSEDTDEKQKNRSDLKGVDRLIENFRNLLNDELNSDLILKTNDHEFHAHRSILCARCPVFASMLHHDMKESKTGEVDISDCTTAAFRLFLNFLYTGKVDTMSSENVLDLYYVADKYQVDDLKSDCVEFMKDSLSVDNFCGVLALSLRHTESELLKFATTFFCKNIKKIVKTVQWQKYITDYPIHANKLIIKAINA